MKQSIDRDIPGPWKRRSSTQDCGTEHRNWPFFAKSDCAQYEGDSARSRPNTQQTEDVKEKDEEERLSEDDISTDECKKGDLWYQGDNSEEEGA